MLKAVARAFSFLSLLFLGLSLLVALNPKLAAQQWVPGAQGIPIVCGYSASPPAALSGTFIYAQCDVNGNVLVNTSGGGGTSTVNQGTGGASAWLVTGTGGTFPITATSLPLPTGAATSALQSTANGSLATIATNTGAAIPAGSNLIGAAAPFGTATMATGQVSCGTTDTTIVAARTGVAGTGRASVTLTNLTGTQAIELGNSGVTTATGLSLPAVAGVAVTLNTTAAIHCITVTAAQTISYVETY